jgi:hypothetical protein
MVKRSLVHVVLGLGALALGCGGNGSGAGGVGPGANGGSRGGTGGASGSDGIALAVEDTVPQDMATGIATDAAVSVQFDAALEGTTVTTTSFTVRGVDGAQLAGIVDAAGPNAIFTPDEPFALMGTYTAMLTTDIESVDGHTLRADHSWSFTTRDGAWGEPVAIEVDDTADATHPRVAVNGRGNAITVWRHGSSVGARRYVLGKGWEPTRVVHEGGSISPPEVAVASERHAIAVWNETQSGRSSVRASHHTPETLLNPNSGWDDAELLEFNDSTNTREPHVAMHPSGSAVAVWAQPDGAYDSIWANRFAPMNGWMGPELIETNNAGHAGRPRVAVDPLGNAVAVWIQRDGSRPDVWANRFTPQGGWGNAERIETDDGDAEAWPQVAVDFDGNAIAVWHQSDGSRSNAYANRFTSDAGWAGAEPIETGDGDAFLPRVALDSRGNAIAVWAQMGNVHRDIWASRFTPDASWGTPELLEINSAGSVGGTLVAVDPNGNAIAAWTQHDGSNHNLWANRYTPNAGWHGAELLERNDATTTSAHIAVSPKGSAVVVWGELMGPNNIWANHFE